MKIYLVLVSLIALMISGPQAFALATAATATSTETTAPTTAPLPADPQERDTPRGTLKGFLTAVAGEKYDEAAQYMDLSALSRTQRARGAVFAQNLQKLLDRKGWLEPEGSLSADPEGHKDDGLEEGIDYAGQLRLKSGDVPIELQRITTKDNVKIWVFSANFVEKIPELSLNLEAAPVDKLMIGALETFKVQGAPIGHWGSMLVLYVFAYLISGFFVRVFIRLARNILRRKTAESATPSERNLIDAFETPLRLYATIWIAALSALFLGLSVIVRNFFTPLAMMIGWIAVGLFLWRLADLAVSMVERRMANRGRYSMTSLLAFARRAAKFVFILIVIIMILNSWGVNVTAGLAALGIGGIALALGAQKTLENFIGSLSIIADQPFHVGDFCKIGDVSGTVEDIGMRSTRLRTNDRTIVTIPNGDLSTQRIENFARRTRFLLNRTIILRYDSKPAQIKKFVEVSTEIFKMQEKIVKEGTMVRFLGFTSTGYQIQLWANVGTSSFDEFMAIQSDITMKVIDAAWECGLYFAIPSQTFLPAKDQTGLPADKDETENLRTIE